MKKPKNKPKRICIVLRETNKMKDCAVYISKEGGIYVHKNGVVAQLCTNAGIKERTVGSKTYQDWSIEYLRMFHFFGLITEEELQAGIEAEDELQKGRLSEYLIEEIDAFQNKTGIKITKAQIEGMITHCKNNS